jgi:hypothetical protein
MRARLAAAQAEASTAALSEEEKELAGLAEQEREAKQEAAAARTARRTIRLADMLAKAEAKAGGRYLVAAIDIVGLFRLGIAPAEEKLPGGGCIIVREPAPEAYNKFTREGEAHRLDHGPLFTDFICGAGSAPSCLEDPPPTPENVTLLRGFCERYVGAAIGIGDVIAKLGGAKQEAAKRGRT